MAHDSDLPCDGDGVCMVCKKKPPPEEALTCRTCVTPWHVTCLSSSRPETLADAAQWECPDCSFVADPNPQPLAARQTAVHGGSEPSAVDLVAAVRAIESDGSLTEQEKAKRRQELMSGGGAKEAAEAATEADRKKGRTGGGNDVLDLLDGNLNCSFCMQLPERPVTTPCGHNFCLKCFQKWVAQGKRTCANCRETIPSKMASQPRINSALVIAIRMAKMSKSVNVEGAPKVYHFIHNQNRPDKAFTTERAKKTGNANACSGKIFVTVPPDHFGPILAENDPDRNQGVLVGECWEDRMSCRQWGIHLPHVAGIAGQADYGAQSVVISGGYEDDEDHGEWFLYTGSGGRDLSGNKRTNKTQSFDQKFDKFNEALRISCLRGYPVRVVRSHKEKRSSYAPEKGLRYDGIYRIEKCWRKVGIQGLKVCRYFFVRCDNDPAPWTSDERGDRPRPFPIVKELKNGTDITERKATPSWDYDEEKDCWLWKKSPPESRKQIDNGNLDDGNGTPRVRRKKQSMSIKAKLLKEFSCLICRKVMASPLTTPCAHNFCKACLEGKFAGKSFINQRTCEGRRTLRAQKNIMKCPSCSNDISDFLQNPQVNRELMDLIESLQRQTEEAEENVESAEHADDTDKKSDMVATESETCDTDSEGQEDVDADKEEAEAGAPSPPMKIKASPVKPEVEDGAAETKKPKRSYKRKNGANEIGSIADEDNASESKKPKRSYKPKNGAKEIGSTADEDTVSESIKPKRSYKRKSGGNEIGKSGGNEIGSTAVNGVKTRSKKAKPEVNNDDDFA